MFNYWIVVRQYKLFLITLLINFVFCDSNFALTKIFNYLSIVSFRWKKFSLQGDHQYQISRKFIFPPVFRRKSHSGHFLRSTVTCGWPPSSGVGSRAKGMAERKERQAEEDTEEERERDTHIHIFTHALARTMTIIMTI